MEEKNNEYFFLKTLLFAALFVGVVVYLFGFEGIYAHAFWFIGISVVMLGFLGLYINAIEQLKEEKKIPQDTEEFGTNSFTLLLIALSMIAITIYVLSNDKYHKRVGYKVFEVFNYSNVDKSITIDNKRYILHPKTHKKITFQKEKVKVDDKEYKKNGWYLVNISGGNVCYELKKLHIFSSLVTTMPNSYATTADTSGIIREKVYRYTKGNFLVFPNETFSVTDENKDKYYGVSIVPCY